VSGFSDLEVLCFSRFLKKGLDSVPKGPCAALAPYCEVNASRCVDLTWQCVMSRARLLSRSDVSHEAWTVYDEVDLDFEKEVRNGW
jgi:hypothetical protein